MGSLQVRLGDYVEVHAPPTVKSSDGKDYHYVFQIEELWQNCQV